MPDGFDAERFTLNYLRDLIDHCEGLDGFPAETVQAVRYLLATQATDLNGDACRFPRCACPAMTCSFP